MIIIRPFLDAHDSSREKERVREREMPVKVRASERQSQSDYENQSPGGLASPFSPKSMICAHSDIHHFFASISTQHQIQSQISHHLLRAPN